MPDKPLGHFLAHLKEKFESQAEWRRGKAEEYPHDAIRNLNAANVFEHLAATCKDVSPQWVDAYEKVWDGPHFERASDEENSMMGSIWISYGNAEEFVKTVLKRAK
jgi:hypothetical protein